MTRSSLVTHAVLLPLAAVACGCTDKVAEAQRKYDLVLNSSAAADEICERGRALSDAYLDSGTPSDFRYKKVITDAECMLARNQERQGIFRGPDGKEINVREQVDNAVDAATRNVTY